jgi:hypothetical protein
MLPACGASGPVFSSLAGCGVFVLLLFASGCGAPPPSPDEAARALLASEPFRAARVETIPSELPGRCTDALGGQLSWNRWISLGVARVSEIMTASGPVCRLSVEEVFRREAENWRHRTTSDLTASEPAIILPVAVRSLSRILDLRSAGRGVAEVSFEWQWRLNQAGQRLGIDTAPRRGWAQLVLDEGGWRTSRVEPEVE